MAESTGMYALINSLDPLWYCLCFRRQLVSTSFETLRLLVEYGQQLEEGSGVVIDLDGQIVTEERK